VTRPTRRATSRTPAASATRVAAIDIGSNSIHMIVAESDGEGGFRVLARERDMVRLGKSALGRGTLSRRAVRDGLEAILRMTTLARLKGATRVEAVATSAVREASNGPDFLEQAKALTRLEIRTLSGEEEGALVFRAVRQAVDLGKGWSVLVDLGGGSTEWCTARDGQLRKVHSLRVGSLRGAALLEGDPPTTRSIERLRRDLRGQLRGLRPPHRVAALIATSGTAMCCGDLADLFAGRERALAAGALRELRLRELDEVVTGLRALRHKELAALAPVGEARSESILAGAIALAALTRHAGVDRLLLCDHALREGLVLEMLGAPVPPAGAIGEARKRQVRELAQRAPGMLAHTEQVARLATRLFDLTAPVHNLGRRERRWLEDAALLHDVGYSIHFQRHHKHSQYLIATSTLDAFDPREIEVIAHVARYHRGAAPKRRHATFAALRGWQQEAVRKLAALLRIANALDRTHAARVIELYASVVKGKRVVVEVMSPFDVSLELSAAAHRSDLFTELFGRRIQFRQGLEKPRRGARR
jgi:exopolyphosphatase/guanosine-5'-triphosphate,3'-diphosphate pyrophosphatase